MGELTPDIAEICGIITGDGHLSRYHSIRRSDYRIEIVGNKEEDIDYFIYINKLFKKTFNKRLKWKVEKSYARLYIHSKDLLEQLERIGLVVGNKSKKASIPDRILQNDELSVKFLKGLADTDFSVNFKKGGRKNNSYPRIVGEFASKKLVEDIKIILQKKGLVIITTKEP